MNLFFGLIPGDIIYDEECFPNIFTAGFTHKVTGQRWLFEISFRRNDMHMLCCFMQSMGEENCRTVGYNNLGYDYPLLHFIYTHYSSGIGFRDIYQKSMSIIDTPWNSRHSNRVWESDWIVDQLDLMAMHHFDNKSKLTSLKVLEFNMRMNSVEDLPFPVGIDLTSVQCDVLISYMWHDIDATGDFYDLSQPEIAMRAKLSAEFGINMTNMSDVKIGEQILIHSLEKNGIQCFERQGNKKVKRQTKRETIDLSQAILPWVKMEHPEFQRIMIFIQHQVITETKGVFKNLIASIDGVEYKFGTGGLHASISSATVVSTDTHQIVDVDVKSFYPNLGIKNKMFPAHLGVEFCEPYEGMYFTRMTYDKGTPENGAYKLALNGAYGNSNNKHSVFFDSLYTMTITISGQLSLCMLVEQLVKVPGLSMIQANTDGVTYLCPRQYLEHTRSLCRWWEQVTNLELEEELYSRMFIRDVNNYMAEYESGKLKRIGAYAHETPRDKPGTRELPWYKDHSAIVVAKAAQAALIDGVDIREFIENHDDVMDFMLKCKVPRSNILLWGGRQVNNIVRYYISTDGDILEKVMPTKGPLGEFKRANKLTDQYYQAVMDEIGLGVWDERIHTKNKSVYDERPGTFHTGWTVMLCNNMDDFDGDINYDWYVKQAEKLVKPLTLV